MGSATRRLLARTLRDVTAITAGNLRDVVPVPPSDVPPAPSAAPATCQVICIASGKGGTGKTVVTTNLSVALAREGLRILLFDADLGLANAHLLLGVTPQEDIASVLNGERELSEILVESPEGVLLIPGGSGYSEFAELPDWKLRHLAGQLAACEERADVMLVDLAAGIGPQVMRFLGIAHDVILVTTPDVTALLDAYATIKALAAGRARANLRIIVNRARDEADALGAFEKLTKVVARHLGHVSISLFDWIPHNWYVQHSVQMRKPVVALHPKSFVAGTFQGMATQLAEGHRAWRSAAASDVVHLEDRQWLPDLSFSQRMMRLVFDR
jgi:flagellar biosynthesis protein FlhG